MVARRPRRSLVHAGVQVGSVEHTFGILPLALNADMLGVGIGHTRSREGKRLTVRWITVKAMTSKFLVPGKSATCRWAEAGYHREQAIGKPASTASSASARR